MLLFAIALALLARRRSGREALGAAALALLWNLSSLISLGMRNDWDRWKAAADSVAFASLSMLPALLLSLSLGRRFPAAARTGYLVSALAASLHAAELLVDETGIHRTGLWMVTIAFGVLTAYCMVKSGEMRRSRLAAAMALFLLAMSVSHFGVHTEQGWPAELLLHHAGIPLALLILMQDVRFVLADAFVRFLANVLLAGLFAGAGVALWTMVQQGWPDGGFGQGLLLLAACCILILYAVLRGRLQHLLTRVVFRRPNEAEASEQFRRIAGESAAVDPFLDSAALTLASWIGAPLRSLSQPEQGTEDLLFPEPDGEGVLVPLRLSNGSAYCLRLGERQGGRRYLSEDLQTLARQAARMVEIADQLHEAELRRLVSQAELHALQAQIHPHFLFNALNTLYGVIPKQSATARQMVLNLSDLFRYFLKAERTLIPLQEELRIVEAYLEIEKLRLGDKLSVEIDVAPDAAAVPVPALSVQPLVENAIKHGVAKNPSPGHVVVRAWLVEGALIVEVHDSGSGVLSQDGTGAGLGMDNVGKRLRLHYGEDAALEFTPSTGGTLVRFRIPAAQPQGAVR